MTPELRVRAEALLDELMARHPIGPRPLLRWKAMRVSAGMAYYREWAIGLSTRLITSEERLELTLKHEYAHLMAVARHGRKGAGHSLPWQQAMLELGLDPKVRHDFPVERNQPRTAVMYQCDRCGEEFQRSRKFPRGRQYRHVGCGGVVKFTGRIVPERERGRDVA
ncbi:MAG: SprT-like domain-containing protein [Methanoregulaceae archaeon]|nr:SprT-like domain-containing protein [Methanoregulaceae archaeon]